MLENGFKIGDAEIEQPKSIGVATTVSTQIVQAVASAQYGGSTLSHIDTHWAPYVEMSYKKLLNKVEQGILNEKFVWSELDKEVYDARIKNSNIQYCGTSFSVVGSVLWNINIS